MEHISQVFNYKHQEVVEQKEDSLLTKFFSKVDEKLGPSKVSYQPACQDVREMLMECVIESDCLKLPGSSFRKCIQEGINQECKAIRYDYMLCRKSVVYWTKHHCKDDPR